TAATLILLIATFKAIVKLVLGFLTGLPLMLVCKDCALTAGQLAAAMSLRLRKGSVSMFRLQLRKFALLALT
ncbi:hypothetical protein RZS08_41865, partial [Arthrospira platensis SPKY1]|nr:hypothetical protein [Arthrospira platensis SPKY1]